MKRTYWVTSETETGKPMLRPWLASDGEMACLSHYDRFPNEIVLGCPTTIKPEV